MTVWFWRACLSALIIGVISTSVSDGAEPGWNPPGIYTGTQPVYQLPRDHAFHGGAFYHTNDFAEWHYFTFLGKDLDTGHELSLFWCIFNEGWVKECNGPFQFTTFASLDFETGEFKHSLSRQTGTFASDGSLEGNSTHFNYAVKDISSSYETQYDHPTETWHFKGAGTTSESGSPYSLNLIGAVRFPGYVPAAYWGMESIGIDPQSRQNPQTMYGLSYYYLAPNMEMTGTVTIDGKLHRVSGLAWFEHQWGNFRNTEASRYYYGYARLNNGDFFTWRQYNGEKGWSEPHAELSRFLYINKEGKRDYAFGPAFTYTPTGWWTSPRTGTRYPWYGTMKTPNETYYVGPKWPDQESQSAPGPLIEGVLYFHTGSPSGPNCWYRILRNGEQLAARASIDTDSAGKLGASLQAQLGANPGRSLQGNPLPTQCICLNITRNAYDKMQNRAQFLGLLHDGVITHVSRLGNDVSLMVEIQYLREMLSVPGSSFKIMLKNCTEFEYKPFRRETEAPEILSAKEIENGILVACVDGTLTLRYDGCEISLENGQSVSVDELVNAAKIYWETFRKGNNLS